jgi:transposase
MAYGKACLEKDLKIAELQETITGLKAQLRYRERKEEEGAFGLSTPSSKTFFKENASEEKTIKKGGATPGHKGHGRKSVTEEAADLVFDKDAGDVCPECGTPLVPYRETERTVIDNAPMEPKNILYRLHDRMCPNCKKKFNAKAPVLPGSLYGNSITAQAAVMHYFHGIPMGRICEMTGINIGSLVDIFHRLGRYFSPARETLKNAYRQDPVKHADETGWRNDGQSGYAWLFCTALLSIFLFKNTRSASIPKGIFGEKHLPGVLVVDRYNAYNKLPLKIQYCYAHLLRDLEKLGKDFSGEEEVKSFAGILIPLLSQAMHLNSQDIPDKEYYRKAKKLKKQIMRVCRSPAQHLGIRAFQDIFTTHEDRLFHWAEDRRVPADNNRAERDLRPTVIARKVSFGSSSDVGAETRSILMSVLHTLNKGRGKEPLESVFKSILDKIAENPTADVATLILPKSKAGLTED